MDLNPQSFNKESNDLSTLEEMRSTGRDDRSMKDHSNLAPSDDMIVSLLWEKLALINEKYNLLSQTKIAELQFVKVILTELDAVSEKLNNLAKIIFLLALCFVISIVFSVTY